MIPLYLMDRINGILEHPEYEEHLAKIELLEKDREFCKHDYAHAIAVARITQAYLSDQKVRGISRELVYAAALLHDIGRWVEYQTGEDHALTGARMAEAILHDCNYLPEEIALVQRAVCEHRCSPEEPDLSVLGQALARADDWSRDCRHCSARGRCHKFTDKMLKIVY